ncbi:M48 family metallopeptidase [Lentimicrobium sp. S6]|uniref:M48 family metallopeptidase n=1 Tax=Lentimicrobium sp. S6 TaxID=2735872 RepID=UPI0015573625|nr:M48 family metallopeptidase [Lentimicrobium sp. S6]NPD46296.1 M48 family metallopeptidase [Lentimicrobium sp. S6]
MKKPILAFTALLIALTFLNSCSTVPVTGRSQLNMIPSSEMLSMSFQQYDQFLAENQASQDQANAQMVKRVGQKIQAAVEQYLQQNGYADLLEGYEWEFNLVDNEQVNAWCMPGGKVVVYTGILPITKDETGLAVVMGHEIAHAVAEHGNERMSQQLMQQAGATGLMLALSEKPAETQMIWSTVYGYGSQYAVMLPYSRTHESEADHLGLIFMSMAGYNPQEAPAFWERMSSVGGAKPPEILSTHPSDDTRISNLNKWMPEAMTYYNKSGGTSTGVNSNTSGSNNSNNSGTNGKPVQIIRKK